MSNTPGNLNKGQFDSLDSRIIQYYYAIIKIKSLVKKTKSIQKTLSSGKNDNSIPYLSYITLICGSAFAINDNFMKRLEILSNFGTYRNTSVNVTSTTGHIPYDCPDWDIKPIGKLPAKEKTLESLKLFELLCINTLQAYQKKLHQAKTERMNSSNKIIIESYFGAIDDIIEPIETDMFDDFIIPVEHPNLSSKTSSNDVLTDENYTDEKFENTTTKIDLDIKILALINNQIRAQLDKLKTETIKYKSIKTENQLKKLPHSEFSLHRIVALTFRLNDLYAIYRNIGRRAYISNTVKLHDVKYIFHTKQSDRFTHMLRSNDYYLLNAKKNGMLMASITKLVRQGIVLQTNVKTVSEMIHFVNQGYILIFQFFNNMKEFQLQWTAAEMKYRKLNNMPIKKLTDYQTQFLGVSSESDDKLMNLGRSSSTKKQPIRRNSLRSNTRSSPMTGNEELSKINESNTTDMLKPPEMRLSRSSSVSSGSSSRSNSGILRTPSRNNSRNNSRRSSFAETSSPLNLKLNLDVPQNFNDSNNSTPNSIDRRNSMFVEPSFSGSNSNFNSPSGSIKRRPVSAIYSSPHQNSSLSSLNLQSNHNTIPVARTRGRSNSQPTKTDLQFATSGAALAVFSKSNATNSKNSTHSIKKAASHANMVQPKSSPFFRSPPLTNDESHFTPPPRLTASQRFQQHLKNGSRAGSLTMQKPNVQSFIFDATSPLSRKTQAQMQQQRGGINSPSRSPTRNPSTLDPNVIKTPLKCGSSSSIVDSNVNNITPANNPDKSTDTEAVIGFKTLGARPSIDGKELNGNVISRNSTVSHTSKKSETLTELVNTESSTKIEQFKKKVRFEGVPAYTEAEDAPSSTNKLLKNFGVFRTSLPTKRKEQRLRQQEGSLFLKYNHEFTHDSIPAGKVAMMKNITNPPKSLLNNLSTKSSNGRFSKLKGKVF